MLYIILLIYLVPAFFICYHIWKRNQPEKSDDVSTQSLIKAFMNERGLAGFLNPDGDTAYVYNTKDIKVQAKKTFGFNKPELGPTYRLVATVESHEDFSHVIVHDEEFFDDFLDLSKTADDIVVDIAFNTEYVDPHEIHEKLRVTPVLYHTGMAEDDYD